MNSTVRLFLAADAQQLSRMICRTLQEVNCIDYPPKEIEALSALYSSEYLQKVAEEGSLYVAEFDGQLVGCGAITPHRERPGNAYIMAVFTRPDYIGQGVGRAVMAAVEADPLFREACRVELHASVTARVFYEKLGYVHMDTPPLLRNSCYYMEKR